MKKFLITIIVIVLVLSLCSCGNLRIAKNDVDLQVISGFEADTKLPYFKINMTDYNDFVKYLNYVQINCPYSEFFWIEAA